RWDEGPMLRVLRPLANPLDQQLPLPLANLLHLGVGRRHHHVGVVAGNAGDELARLGIVGTEDPALHQVVRHVEPQIGLARRRVGAVALEAAIGKEGANIATEVDLGPIPYEGDRERQDEGNRPESPITVRLHTEALIYTSR